jgi:hypothetical protein
MNKELKAMPKKAAIIRNLLDRADNMSLATKITDSGDWKIYWEVSGVQHVKAPKEMLQLMSKEELYDFVDNVCNFIVKKFPKDAFKTEQHMPGRVRKPVNVLNIPHDGNRRFK